MLNLLQVLLFILTDFYDKVKKKLIGGVKNVK